MQTYNLNAKMTGECYPAGNNGLLVRLQQKIEVPEPSVVGICVHLLPVGEALVLQFVLSSCKSHDYTMPLATAAALAESIERVLVNGKPKLNG